MVIIAVFLGINGGNSCDINLMFKKFTDVPVITTILISFAIGIFVMLPFTIGHKKKRSPKLPTEKEIPVKKSKIFFGNNKKDMKNSTSATRDDASENLTGSDKTNSGNGLKK
jgi:hypothetical protein